MATHKSVREQVIEQHARKCVHYTGVIGGNILDKAAQEARTCKAGVRYREVERVIPLAEPFKGWDGQMVTTRTLIPCLNGPYVDQTECPLRHFPTLEECEAEADRFEAHRAERRARVERGECAQCGRAVTRTEQVGRCLYNEPCGCRVGQVA